jgi:hypothetical protein
MSSETEIDRVLSHFFLEPDFKIEQLDAEYEDTFRYKIISNINGKKLNCVFIQFFDDHIYIERLGRCELKGGETLDIIEKIAKQLGNISYISLEDDSTLKVYPEFDIWINLYIYKILTKGKSWYNSLEYYSNNYTEELKENAKFKTMTIKEFQEDVSSSDIDNKKYNKHLNDLTDIFSFEPEESMTVPNFYNKIMEIIGKNEPDENKAEWLENDLNFVLESQIINYNAEKLEKRIMVPTGDARGKMKKTRKSKKNKKGRKGKMKKGKKTRRTRKIKKNKKVN